MNNKILSNIKNKITLSVLAVLFATNVATSQTIENQIQDSLAKNKEYNKLLKTVRINEPQIRELELKIYNIKTEMENLQNAYYAQTQKQITRQSTIDKYFTPKQITQINQELSAFGKFDLLTPKSTLLDLHTILVQLNIPTNQLPLTGKAVVKSKYKNFDLRNLATWIFIDIDRNYMYSHYINLLSRLNKAPETFEFKNLVAKLKEYEEKCAQLSIAKQRAIVLRNAIINSYSK